MKEGNKVRLKGKKRTAIIVAMLSSIDGGVFLNKTKSKIMHISLMR